MSFFYEHPVYLEGINWEIFQILKLLSLNSFNKKKNESWWFMITWDETTC